MFQDSYYGYSSYPIYRQSSLCFSFRTQCHVCRSGPPITDFLQPQSRPSGVATSDFLLSPTVPFRFQMDGLTSCSSECIKVTHPLTHSPSFVFNIFLTHLHLILSPRLPFPSLDHTFFPVMQSEVQHTGIFHPSCSQHCAKHRRHEDRYDQPCPPEAYSLFMGTYVNRQQQLKW